MVFIYRKVRARDAQDADDLEARLSEHLVTDFTNRMDNQEGAHFDKQMRGELVETSQPNPQNAYEFRVLYKQGRSLGTTKTGNLLIALGKKITSGNVDWSQWPKRYHPSEVELVIECKPELVTSIDRCLIDEPYALLENREVTENTEARYSFSTNAKFVLSEHMARLLELQFGRKEIIRYYDSLGTELVKIAEEFESVTPDVRQVEGPSRYTSGVSLIRLIGNIRGPFDKVIEAIQQIKHEIEARGYKIETGQIQFYKSGNGLYLPKVLQQPHALPRPQPPSK